MDHNMGYALRAKEMAERKFAANDYIGAKKFAQKAKDTYPDLDFISLFITIIKVFIFKEKIENGESDWYGFLGVKETSSCAEKIRSYNNLYHPIKAGINKVVGAEGALQIVSEAFCVVSGLFWTKCSTCGIRFLISQSRMNDEYMCINCEARFVAVKLPFGTHPADVRMMSRFRPASHNEISAVQALSATSSDPGAGRGFSKQLKRKKKDEREPSDAEIREARRLSGWL